MQGNITLINTNFPTVQETQPKSDVGQHRDTKHHGRPALSFTSTTNLLYPRNSLVNQNFGISVWVWPASKLRFDEETCG